VTARRGFPRPVAALVVTACIALAASVVAADAGRSGGRAAATEPLKIGPITATFIPALRQTDYDVKVFGPAADGHYERAGYRIKVAWTLHLELVDPAGAPASGEAGSGAAVDIGCNNAGDGSPNTPSHGYVVGADYENGKPIPIFGFIWHHPDPAESIPPGKYHCNHLDMGPRGHQGIITVVVRDSNWKCSASYKGTNSTSRNPLELAPTAADIEASERHGTASTPKCSPIH
jgi:hypothetical protein